MKKPFKKSSYRSALDKEDPRYLPYGHKKAYERIDLGWEWKFGENGYGNDDQEVPNMVKDVCFYLCLKWLTWTCSKLHVPGTTVVPVLGASA